MSETPGTPQIKVELRNVSKKFVSGHNSKAKAFYAVQNASLTVKDGEFVALVGPTGCGKSTLLNIVAGFEKADEGEVIFEGKPVTGPGSDRTVIFQEHGLFPWLTVQENVEFGLKTRGVPPAERREIAERYLRMVHLYKYKASYPAQCSGGMKQRAAIARALAVEPHMLLMDEPFSALDQRTRDLLHVELQKLWLQTRKTILLVTHSIEEALRLADRVIVMATQPGRIRRVFSVDIAHPRDFFNPSLTELRATIMRELDDELLKLVKQEGDDDWQLEEGPVTNRSGGSVANNMGSGI